MSEQAPPFPRDLATTHNRILEDESPPLAAAGEQLASRRQVTDRNRRIISLVVASLGLVLLAPLMVVISVLVLLTSGRPVMYSQPRIGIDRRYSGAKLIRAKNRHVNLGGRPFAIYKFRTMRDDPTARKAIWTAENNPRITSFGRFLRLARLDELPQLFNVLRGEMNVVGPRPEQPGIFSRLRTRIDGYEDRQIVLPGITGWAQVSHHYDATIDDVRRKLSLDLEYIRRRSVAEDLRIMAKTIPVMIGRIGSR